MTFEKAYESTQLLLQGFLYTLLSKQAGASMNFYGFRYANHSLMLIDCDDVDANGDNDGGEMMEARMGNEDIDGADKFMRTGAHEHGTGHTRIVIVWC